jgi:hypothetical protein
MKCHLAIASEASNAIRSIHSRRNCFGIRTAIPGFGGLDLGNPVVIATPKWQLKTTRAYEPTAGSGPMLHEQAELGQLLGRSRRR